MNTTKFSLSGLSVLFWLLLSVTGLSEAGDVTLYVNGGAGIDKTGCGTLAKPCKTISYTVYNSAQQNNNSQINIAAGTYPESIVINNKNISLSGAGVNLTFIVGNNTNAAISAFGPAFVKITNLSVNNGNPGIAVNSAIMKITNTYVGNNSFGIQVQSNSSLDFQGGIVESNTIHGISVTQNSSANIGSSTITSNNGNGINVDMSSSVNIANSNLTSNNIGMLVMYGSSASIQGSTVSNNMLWGMNATGTSSLRLSGGNKIKSNAANGVMIEQNSQLTIQRHPSTTIMDEISLNSGDGIEIGDNSSLNMFDGIIKSNNNNGITVVTDSLAHFNTSSTTISENLGWGLNCSGDSKYVGPLGTVLGNGQGPINCLSF
jgi:hypothetical protein